VKSKELEKYLNGVLETEKFIDYCYDGLQIEGKNEVKKIAFGVSLNLEFIEKSIQWGADTLFVHHGIFGKDFFKLQGYLKKRVELIIKNDLNLFGYHLPLDANEKYGNNASIAAALSLDMVEFLEDGYICKYDKKIPWNTFYRKLKSVFYNDIICFQNSDYVKNVYILSGGGSFMLEQLPDKNIDTFITGEVKEQIPHLAKETGINFINAGHYYTETFGVKNIAELLKKEFGFETCFIDVPNSI